MRCIYCGNTDSKVVDSRSNEECDSIRRRRECLKCGKRFTTYEKIESISIIVIKNDKSRQPFDREKIFNGILRACEKRHISTNQIESMVDEIESVIYNTMDKEISSARIGELVMEKLQSVDEVAYVRFASVYKRFKDINSFMDELAKMIEKNK